MGSRVRLLTAGDSWWRSPSRSAYYRRQSVDQALDAIIARTAPPQEPSLISRVRRPVPLLLLALLLAGAATTVYFTLSAIETNAAALHRYIAEAFVENSQLVAEHIRDVVVDSTESIYAPFEPSDHETNVTATTAVNTTIA